MKEESHGNSESAAVSSSAEAQYFVRLTGSNNAAQLAATLGLPTPFAAGEDFIPQCATGRDSVIVCNDNSVVPPLVSLVLVSARERESRRRVAVVISDTDTQFKIIECTALASLTSSTIADLALTGGGYTGDVLVGSAEETRQFFESEASRATDIGKVILVGITPETRTTLEGILEIASKRARRPQLISVSPSRSADVEALTVRYFQLPRGSLTHVQLELEGDVLAKPNALSALLESEGRCPTIVFCNQPSDADFVEVLLKKAGLSTAKLVGNVPAAKVQQSLTKVLSGSTVALIVTDVAARNIDPHEFEIIVNYSIPSDPEVYIHRTESAGTGQSLRKVVNLVGPLDRANFHYIKKVVEADFVEGNLPPAEAVLEARVGQLRKRALEAGPLISTELQKVAAFVNDGENRAEIIAYLLSMEAEHAETGAQQSSNQPEYNDDFGDRDRDQRDTRRNDRGRDDRGRNNERGRDDRNRDNRNRGDRNDNRGGDNRGADNRGGDNRNNDRHGRSNRNQGGEQQNDGRRDRGQQSREEGHNPRRHEPQVPPLPIARLYIEPNGGVGLTEDAIRKVLTDTAPELVETLVRVSARPNYAFIDIHESALEGVKTALAQVAAVSKSDKPGVLKALSLSIPQEAPAGASTEKQDTPDQDHERQEQPHRNDGNDGDEQGPTVVDFDEQVTA